MRTMLMHVCVCLSHGCASAAVLAWSRRERDEPRIAPHTLHLMISFFQLASLGTHSHLLPDASFAVHSAARACGPSMHREPFAHTGAVVALRASNRIFIVCVANTGVFVYSAPRCGLRESVLQPDQERHVHGSEVKVEVFPTRPFEHFTTWGVLSTRRPAFRITYLASCRAKIARVAASWSSASSSNGPSHFQAPKEFGGEDTNFDESGFKLKEHLSIMNVAVKRAMDKVEERLEQEVFDACFNDEHGKPLVDLLETASQLQWVLLTLCTGPASILLRRETATNGFESWRHLVQRYKIPTKARVAGRLSKILRPSFWEKNFGHRLTTWEDRSQGRAGGAAFSCVWCKDCEHDE